MCKDDNDAHLKQQEENLGLIMCLQTNKKIKTLTRSMH